MLLLCMTDRKVRAPLPPSAFPFPRGNLFFFPFCCIINEIGQFNFIKINEDIKLSESKKATAGVVLTPELADFISQWKNKPGNLIMVLHRVQQTYGFIPREIAFEISALLDVPLAKIYGVLTFYNFFKLEKAGRNIIQVCLGTACYLRGGEDIINEFERELGVGVNVTTPDGEFSVEAVRCIGCCGLAPAIMINGEVHGKLKNSQIKGLIAKYRKA